MSAMRDAFYIGWLVGALIEFVGPSTSLLNFAGYMLAVLIVVWLTPDWIQSLTIQPPSDHLTLQDRAVIMDNDLWLAEGRSRILFADTTARLRETQRIIHKLRRLHPSSERT